MNDPQQDPDEGGATPDFNFSLTDPHRSEFSATARATVDEPVGTLEPQSSEVRATADSGAEPAVERSSFEQRTTELINSVARELVAVAPDNWHRLEAVFALTVAGGVSFVLYYDEADRVLQHEPSREVVELARLHRETSATPDKGPWWRLLLDLDGAGEVTVELDYGQEPFPDDQLLDPEAYVADLQAFPRDRVPLWLAAYISHGNRQLRSARQAAVQARTDREVGIAPVLSENDFPELATLWARWATIAAAFVAVRSDWGPRVLPALAAFEGSARSGSTLFLLPGERAVLSGGLWNAPELDGAYNGGAPLPEVYAGAPEWVADQVLNPRAATGLLSFCYWWDRGHWYRGQSPASDRIRPAVPGVWSVQDVIEILCGVVSTDPTDEQRSAAADLVTAAETGSVTRKTVTALFDDPDDDIDAALYQLSVAGLLAPASEELPKDRAIAMVRRYIDGRDIETTNYPLDELVAERLDVGWAVFVPTRPGEIAIGRAVFYIADDGVIEQSSSSIAPSIYAEGFEQRFYDRQFSAVDEVTT